MSPFYQAIGTNPLRDGPPWGSWALLAGLAGLFVGVGIVGLRRRDIRQ